METVLLILGVWLAIAFVVALFVGRAIAVGNGRLR